MRNHTKPLQPPTLAAFPPWGNSKGAGRTTLTPQRYIFFGYDAVQTEILLFSILRSSTTLPLLHNSSSCPSLEREGCSFTSILEGQEV